MFEKELAWILFHLVQRQPELQRVPGRSGLNQLLSKNDPQATIIDPLPIVNAAAHKRETLCTVTLKCKAMTKLTHGRCSIITLDKAFCSKAKMLQCTKTDECKYIVIILGGFYATMTFSKVIGKYVESSGLNDIWAESKVFGETTAINVVKGKM